MKVYFAVVDKPPSPALGILQPLVVPWRAPKVEVSRIRLVKSVSGGVEPCVR